MKDSFIFYCLVLLFGIVIFTIVFGAISSLTNNDVQALEPEFKIFSVCLEGKKFAIAMRQNSIHMTQIMDDGNTHVLHPMRCK